MSKTWVAMLNRLRRRRMSGSVPDEAGSSKVNGPVT
jgi:hypothetical protein